MYTKLGMHMKHSYVNIMLRSLQGMIVVLCETIKKKQTHLTFATLSTDSYCR